MGANVQEYNFNLLRARGLPDRESAIVGDSLAIAGTINYNNTVSPCPLTWSDALEERPGGKLSGSVHRLPVVVRSPAGRVDGDVLVVVSQRPAMPKNLMVKHKSIQEQVDDESGTFGFPFTFWDAAP